jgi:DNA-binding NarL/FixJ family response regulator
MPDPTSSKKRPRVLVADDYQAILDRVVSLLSPHFEVVGAVSDGRTAVHEAARLQPDAIVMDLSMPLLSGIEAAHELRKAGSTAKLVFLTMHFDNEFVRACLSAGALGYVIKSRIQTDLVSAINEALSGREFISPGVSRT